MFWVMHRIPTDFSASDVYEKGAPILAFYFRWGESFWSESPNCLHLLHLGQAAWQVNFFHMS